MAKLFARLALEGLPLEIGAVRLTAVLRTRETLIQPFRGGGAAVSEALVPLGLRFPSANTWRAGADAEIIWAGRGRALLIGAEPPEALAGHAALVNQTGAQAVVLLAGHGIEHILARLVPIDLRLSAFPEGAVAQTMLGHMMAQVRRTGAGIEVAVMRSMAGTLLHDLSTAARHLAARHSIVGATPR